MDVLKMLENVGANTLGTPKWSLRITVGKIYLDLAWDKDTRIPAKNSEQPKVSMDLPTTPKPHKKKSPSTRRRDRLRYQNWKSKKRRDLASRPSPEPVEAPATTPGTAEPLDQTVPIVTNPAEVVKLVKPSQDTPTNVETNTRTSDGHSGKADKLIPAWKSDFNEIVAGLPLCHPEKAKTICWNCLIPEKQNECLKKCTQCAQALYCSRECQKDHWKANHGKFCKKIMAWHKNHNQRLADQQKGQGSSCRVASGTLH